MVAMVDIAESAFVAVVAAPEMVDMVEMVDIAGSVFVAAPDMVEMVDIAGSVFVAAPDMVEMVDIAGSVFVGTADVDRHRLVVPWLPSYTVVQFVVGFLNSRSCLGWSNYIVGYSNLHRMLID